MKYNTLLLALLLLLATFVSCHKPDDDPAPRVPKIKTITHGTNPGSDMEFYEYDALGRVSNITITGHAPNHIRYEYLKDKIVMLSEIGISVDTILLNDKGLAKSEMFGAGIFEYDTQGYLSKSTYYGSDGAVDLEYRNNISEGNTTFSKVYEMHGNMLLHAMTINYEFLPRSVNTIGNENKGISWMGKQDKNLLSVSTEQYIGSVYANKRRFLYETDAQNRVVKRWSESFPEGAEIFTYYE